MSDIHTMPLKTSAEMLAKKLYEIEDFAREALQSRPGAVGEDWAYLMNALADVKKICADELGEYRTPKAVLDPSAPPCTPPPAELLTRPQAIEALMRLQKRIAFEGRALEVEALSMAIHNIIRRHKQSARHTAKNYPKKGK